MFLLKRGMALTPAEYIILLYTLKTNYQILVGCHLLPFAIKVGQYSNFVLHASVEFIRLRKEIMHKDTAFTDFLDEFQWFPCQTAAFLHLKFTLSSSLTLTVLGYFELHMTGRGGGGGGAWRPPFRFRPQWRRSPRNLARASEIAQRERPRCYFFSSQKLHILLVTIIYANHIA